MHDRPPLVHADAPPLALRASGQCNSRSDVIEETVRRTLIAAGRADACPPPKEFKGEAGAKLGIIDTVMVSARDALLQQPNASYEKLCESTSRLNAFNSIEVLMTT